ncbi:hypothetical protein ACFX2I_014382 [Malus domestica]
MICASSPLQPNPTCVHMVRTPGAAIPSTQPSISRSSFSACSSNKTKSECQWCVETLHHPLLLLQDPHLPFSESPSAILKALVSDILTRTTTSIPHSSTSFYNLHNVDYPFAH